MDKKKDAEKYCQEGRSTRQKNAVVCYTRAIKLEKNNSNYLLEMAHTVGHQERYKEASVLYKIVACMDSKNALIYYSLGYILQMLEKDDESIEMYKKALDLDPNYADVCYNLANIFIMQGKYEEAHEYYRKVLELQPSDDYLVANCLGYSYFLQGKFAKAIQELQKSISLNEKDPFAYCNMSLVLFCENKSEEAFKYFEGGMKVLGEEESPIKVFEEIIKSYSSTKTNFEVELDSNKGLDEKRRTVLRIMINGLTYIINLLTKRMEK